MDLGGVCSEKVEAVELRIVLIRTTHPDDDKADEGGDGAYHGQEDTCEAACFAHNDGAVTYGGLNQGMVMKIGRRLNERQYVGSLRYVLYDRDTKYQRGKFVYLMYKYELRWLTPVTEDWYLDGGSVLSLTS